MPQNGSLFYKPKPPQRTEIRKKRWNAGAIIWKALKRTCMVIGAMVLISAFLTFITLTSAVQSSAPSLPKEMILVMKLEEGIVEKPDSASFADLIPASRPTIKQTINALDAAAKDKRIKALVVNLKGGSVSLAHIQELRAAIKRFRAADKKAYFYSNSFADNGPGIGGYYLASAFDEIWMQPVGMISVTGFGAEIPLARDALEKVGVTPQFLHREEYKSAMETFTESELTPASRESWNSVLSGMYADVMGGITADRNLNEGDMRRVMSYGMMDGDMALEAGLIDRLDYGDVLVSELRGQIKGDPEDDSLELVSFRQYSAASDGAQKDKGLHGIKDSKARVAMIYVNGQIVQSSTGANSAAADDIAPAIIAAAEDDGIDTILLRVNSPGGSPTASETIRRAVVRAKEKGKYVVVSMGDLAASGGYWVSTDADTIFAYPSTLTGSIGVIMGKFEASDFWPKVGVNWATVSVGENAGLWSMNKPFTADQLVQLNRLIDATYFAFLNRVAEGRNMSVEDVRSVAKGRVWTGQAASERGLIDQIGGLYDALNFIALKNELISPENLEVIIMPKPKSRIEQFLEMLGGDNSLVSAIMRMDKIVTVLEPFIATLDRAQNPQAYSVYDSEVEFMRP